jgi:hypothetical protein
MKLVLSTHSIKLQKNITFLSNTLPLVFTSGGITWFFNTLNSDGTSYKLALVIARHSRTSGGSILPE